MRYLLKEISHFPILQIGRVIFRRFGERKGGDEGVEGEVLEALHQGGAFGLGDGAGGAQQAEHREGDRDVAAGVGDTPSEVVAQRDGAATRGFGDAGGLQHDGMAPAEAA